MKKTKLFLSVLTVIMAVTSCNKSEKAVVYDSDSKVEAESDVEAKLEDNTALINETEGKIEPEEKDEYSPLFALYDRGYFGIIARSTVNDDNVNVRLLPNVSSEKIGSLNKGYVVEILGYSNSKETINDYEGYWLKISFKEKPKEYYGLYGWVFSQYVDVEPSVDVSKFGAGKIEDGELKTIEIERNGVKTESTVYVNRLTDTSPYTFVWCDEMRDFNYNDPTGVFRWDPDTNEITNLTNMGSECESAWCLISDDLKFMFQDFGTSPGTRALGVYDMETTKQIFSGSYYRELGYDGESICIVKKYGLNHSDENVKKFREETPLTEEQLDWINQGMSVNVIVKYRFNLFTKDMEFVECDYLLSQ